MTIAYEIINSHFWLLEITVFSSWAACDFFPPRKSLRQTLKMAYLDSCTTIYLELLLVNIAFHSVSSFTFLLSLSTKTLIEASELHCYGTCSDHWAMCQSSRYFLCPVRSNESVHTELNQKESTEREGISTGLKGGTKWDPSPPCSLP